MIQMTREAESSVKSVCYKHKLMLQTRPRKWSSCTVLQKKKNLEIFLATSRIVFKFTLVIIWSFFLGILNVELLLATV